MMQTIVNGHFDGVEIRHVRMAFSVDIGDVGKIRIRKAAHLLVLIARILFERIRFQPAVLYYPPAGPSLVPVARDIVLLTCTRWMFKRIVFHFEAAGLTGLYARLPPLIQWLFRAAYYRPYVGVRTSSFTPEDPQMLRAVHELIIPNAIVSTPPLQRVGLANHPPVVLFVGALRESKGVRDLLRAAKLLIDRGISVRVRLVGEFESGEFAATVREQIVALGIQDLVDLSGLLFDEAKDQAFRDADIFCFPTYYESEASPLVLIEATRASLPIVATKWRGIPDIVHDGVNGILTPVGDSDAIAEGISRLLLNPDLARRMGDSGRQLFESNFSTQAFQRRMVGLFELVRHGLR